MALKQQLYDHVHSLVLFGTKKMCNQIELDHVSDVCVASQMLRVCMFFMPRYMYVMDKP